MSNLYILVCTLYVLGMIIVMMHGHVFYSITKQIKWPKSVNTLNCVQFCGHNHKLY